MATLKCTLTGVGLPVGWPLVCTMLGNYLLWLPRTPGYAARILTHIRGLTWGPEQSPESLSWQPLNGRKALEYVIYVREFSGVCVWLFTSPCVRACAFLRGAPKTEREIWDMAWLAKGTGLLIALISRLLPRPNRPLSINFIAFGVPFSLLTHPKPSSEQWGVSRLV